MVAERFYFIDTRPTLTDKVRLKQKISKSKSKSGELILRRASSMRRSTRSIGRSGYAFAHQEGFGKLITSGANMRSRSDINFNRRGGNAPGLKKGKVRANLEGAEPNLPPSYAMSLNFNTSNVSQTYDNHVQGDNELTETTVSREETPVSREETEVSDSHRSSDSEVTESPTPRTEHTEVTEKGENTERTEEHNNTQDSVVSSTATDKPADSVQHSFDNYASDATLVTEL